MRALPDEVTIGNERSSPSRRPSYVQDMGRAGADDAVVLPQRGSAHDKVYLVVGSTGEFDDYYKWVAAALLDGTKAKRLRTKLNRIAASHGSCDEEEQRSALVNKLAAAGDSNAVCDYNGVSYRVEEHTIAG
jgi:hypothetical protein